MYNITGVCKDCGNGTLNGVTSPQFHIYEGKYNDVVLCNGCDSSHVEVVVVENETLDTWDNPDGSEDAK
jgi:hypothetical protein